MDFVVEIHVSRGFDQPKWLFQSPFSSLNV